MSAHLTEHAKDRGKERLGLAKAALLRTAEIALRDGFKHRELSGPLRRYVDGLYLKRGTANNIRIHGEQVFVFDGDKLITVHPAPQHLRPHLAKLRRHREEDQSQAAKGPRHA